MDTMSRYRRNEGDVALEKARDPRTSPAELTEILVWSQNHLPRNPKLDDRSHVERCLSIADAVCRNPNVSTVALQERWFVRDLYRHVGAVGLLDNDLYQLAVLSDPSLDKTASWAMWVDTTRRLSLVYDTQLGSDAAKEWLNLIWSPIESIADYLSQILSSREEQAVWMSAAEMLARIGANHLQVKQGWVSARLDADPRVIQRALSLVGHDKAIVGSLKQYDLWDQSFVPNRRRRSGL